MVATRVSHCSRARTGIGLHGEVHERVDLVVDPEVVGSDRDVRPAPAAAARPWLVPPRVLAIARLSDNLTAPACTERRARHKPVGEQ